VVALIFAWFCGLAFVAGPVFAQEPVSPEAPANNIQIFRNPRETVVVISGVLPLDKASSLARGNLAAQMKQALENLRRMALRAGVLPGQIVTITVFTPETDRLEPLRLMARELYADWTPFTAVENRQLGTAGALVELEAVAIARDAKAR